MKEEIKNRIEAVRRGEVPEGYKRENGYVIPNEWNTTNLKSVFSRSKKKNHIGCDNVLTISAQMGLISQRDFYEKDIASEDKSEYYLMKNGDFAYNKSYSAGYDYGAIKRLDKYTEGVVSPLYICMTPQSETNSDFYVQYFEAGRYNREIYRFAQEGARNHGLLNIAVEDFFNGVVAVPSETEQQKIAEILAACDKVIELKQKLIEEKRRQKKWLMQKLLDPDSGVRLPGFEGSKWTSYQIKDVAEVINGGTPDTSLEEYWNGEVLWCTPSDISAAKKYISSTSQKITDKGLSNSSATLLPVGAILMCSRATIGPRAIATLPITTNQGFKSFVCKEQINNEFFYYYLDVVVPNFLKLSAGNTFKEVSKADVEKEIIHIPALPEQIAIVSILSSVDKQIELYEQELAKWQQKKKALMQLLLTGLVRCK